MRYKYEVSLSISTASIIQTTPADLAHMDIILLWRFRVPVDL